MRARIDELGGPTLHNNYPWGWTMAGNTPFRRWKREVHEGGVADPCIVRLPVRLAGGGGVRRQFAHAIDVFPTLLELLGIEPPAELRASPNARSRAPALRTSSPTTAATRPSATTPSTSRCWGPRSTTAGGRR